METKTKLWSKLYGDMGVVVQKAMSPSKYPRRAALIAQELKQGDSVLEIGCGYGGLAKEIMKLVYVKYTVVDNKEMLALASKTLDDDVEYVEAGDIQKVRGKKFTMFISHFCLSETPKRYRNYILRYILPNCSKISVYDFEDALKPSNKVLELGLDIFPLTIEKQINKYFHISKATDPQIGGVSPRFRFTGDRKK